MAPDGVPHLFDRRLLAARRQRAAAIAGDDIAYLVDHVAADFAERLAVIRRDFASVVCVGANGDRLAARLRQRAGLRPKVGPADEDGAIALAPESADLICSALSLQLCNDVPGALAQMRRALKPDGLLLAALLGGASLGELREAWLIAEAHETGGASPRVAPFADVRDLGALLQRAGFALPVADSEILTVRFPTPLALMSELKAMGASNALVERRRTPTTRRLLLAAAAEYADRFSDPDGRVRATFEIITLTGWAPHDNQQKPLRPGSAATRLADALGVAERPAGDKADP